MRGAGTAVSAGKGGAKVSSFDDADATMGSTTMGFQLKLTSALLTTAVGRMGDESGLECTLVASDLTIRRFAGVSGGEASLKPRGEVGVSM
jgi:hypothetical protein